MTWVLKIHYTDALNYTELTIDVKNCSEIDLSKMVKKHFFESQKKNARKFLRKLIVLLISTTLKQRAISL